MRLEWIQALKTMGNRKYWSFLAVTAIVKQFY